MRLSAIFFVYCLVLVKLVDLSLGFFIDIPSSSNKDVRSLILKEHRPLLDLHIPADPEYLRFRPEDHGRLFRFKTDVNGYILGSDETVQDSEVPIDVMFLGGSTTESMFVDEQFRFPDVVQRSLRDLIGAGDINVVNAGVGGNHTYHSLLNFLGKGLSNPPKVLVLMHAVNDVALLSKTGSYHDAPVTRRLIQRDANGAVDDFSIYSILRGVKDYLLSNTWTIVRGSSFVRDIIGNIKNDEWKGYRSVVTERIILDALENDYRANLESIVSIAKNNNVIPVLMTQFNRLEPNSSAYSQYVKQLTLEEEVFSRLYAHTNQIIRDVSEKNNVALIDLDKMIPKESKYIYDAVHLTKEGNLMVAEAVVNSLINHTLIKERLNN